MQKIHCPHCKREICYHMVKDVPTFPFCSERCKMVDLGAWLEEAYCIVEPVNTEVSGQLEKKE